MITKDIFRSRINKMWPSNKIQINKEEKLFYCNKIKLLLKKLHACLIVHYYVDADIQRLAEETGGMIGDSLSMSKFGKYHKSKILVIVGVKFMGETAKILSPNKTVIMPTLNAECSLDISCRESEFKSFINQYPNYTKVVYINTSARIKALSDWIVTSSNAISICKYLHNRNKKILWAPDKYLGRWIQKSLGITDMVSYKGSCIVHEEFKAKLLHSLKKKYPNAAILVHPESPEDVISMAHVVGSTSKLLEYSQKLPNKVFIVATDKGIFYKMKQISPKKIFIEAPTAGYGATCKSCAHCPWMSMNNLKNLSDTLENQSNKITLPCNVIKKAVLPLNKMFNFQKNFNTNYFNSF